MTILTATGSVLGDIQHFGLYEEGVDMQERALLKYDLKANHLFPSSPLGRQRVQKVSRKGEEALLKAYPYDR